MNSANCAITNECRRIHANITNDLKRTLTNDNELGFSPFRQYAHGDVGSFLSMCEEAFKPVFCTLQEITKYTKFPDSRSQDKSAC